MAVKSDAVPFWFGVTNKSWVSVKVQYLFIMLSVGSYQPFLVLYYVFIGLTPTQIGVIETTFIVIGVISRPLFGTIADRSGRHYLVLGLCILLFSVPCFLMGYFTLGMHSTEPLLHKEGHQLKICKDPLDLGNNITMCPSLASAKESCDIICHDINATIHVLFDKPANATNCLVREFNTSEALKISNCFPSANSSAYDNRFVFLTIGTLRLVSALTFGPMFSLNDAIAYDMLGPNYRNLWGQQRMFGTLGWGLSSFFMGLAIEKFQTFAICFGAFPIFAVSALFVAFIWLPKRLVHKSHESQMPFCQAVRSVFKSPIFCIDCVVAIASGMMFAPGQVLLPQVLKSLNAPKMLFGFMAAIICAFEIPSLFFAGKVVDRLGEIPCFLAMFAAYALRFLCSGILQVETVWLALPIETLHVFCYGFYFPAATRLAANLAPPGTSSTIQSILSASYVGIGKSCGLLIASLLYEHLGGQISFFIFAGYAAACFLILFIAYFAYLRKNYKPHTSKNRSDGIVVNAETNGVTTPALENDIEEL